MNYRINRIGIRNNPYHVDYKHTIVIRLEFDAKLWHALRKRGHLGHIYNADMANMLSREYNVKGLSVPTVSDSRRAKRGIKYVTVTFDTNDQALAIASGLNPNDSFSVPDLKAIGMAEVIDLAEYRARKAG